MEKGFVDTFRAKHEDKILYTSNKVYTGLRLDYWIVSKDALSFILDSRIYNILKGSDHSPTRLQLKVKSSKPDVDPELKRKYLRQHKTLEAHLNENHDASYTKKTINEAMVTLSGCEDKIPLKDFIMDSKILLITSVNNEYEYMQLV